MNPSPYVFWWNLIYFWVTQVGNRPKDVPKNGYHQQQDGRKEEKKKWCQKFKAIHTSFDIFDLDLLKKMCLFSI
jgi:hypothetical protein